MSTRAPVGLLRLQPKRRSGSRAITQQSASDLPQSSAASIARGKSSLDELALLLPVHEQPIVCFSIELTSIGAAFGGNSWYTTRRSFYGTGHALTRLLRGKSSFVRREDEAAVRQERIREGTGEKASDDREIARACFDIDKIVTIKELRNLGQILIDRAVAMEMIAAERVFDAILSQRLAGQARMLRRVARTLEPLERAAAKAKPPKAA